VSRRKRKSSARWLWALGALCGVVIAYVLIYGIRRSGSIPVPGEMPRAVGPSVGPREDIHDSERQRLERLLHEHAHGQ